MHKLVLAACAMAALSATIAAAQPAGGGMRAFIAQADANHDGAITGAEWNAARAARFTAADTNHDGQLSGDERPHWGPPPGSGNDAGQPPAGGAPPGGGEHRGMNADTNNDGAISRAEYDAQSAAMFQHLDADGNGAVTTAELQAAHDRMRPH